MNFNEAIARAAAHAGWQIENFRDRSDLFIWELTQPAGRGMRAQVQVRRQDIANSWDKLDENKQKHGLDKLTKHLSRNLREGMTIFLNSADWTPDE